MLDSTFREKEENKFLLTSKKNLTKGDFVTFFNFIVLLSVKNYENKTIDKNECFKIIDKADGYLFAFEDGLINGLNLFNKFKIIMEEDFYVRDWDYKVIYEEV